MKFASSQRLPELRAGPARKRDRAHHLEKVDDAVTVNRKVLNERERISFAGSSRSCGAGPSIVLGPTLTNE